MDSMVNHYTVSKRLRDKDLYSPGGKMGLRPDRATIVYCNKIREAYKNITYCYWWNRSKFKKICSL